MPRRQLPVLVHVGLALLIGFALVGSVSAAATPGTPLALRGTFTTHLTGAEKFSWHGYRLPAGIPNPGTWKLVLTQSNASFHNPGSGATFPVGPTFRFADGRFSFGFDPNCPHKYGSANGIYTYRFIGRTLTFRVVQDSCLDRVATLVLHPWHKQ